MADSPYTHQDLCRIALRWLRGTQRCVIALSGIASTSEIPDAIGWSTRYRSIGGSGSILVECKTSRADWRRDRLKNRLKWQFDEADKLINAPSPRMGKWRYFLTPPGLVTAEEVRELYPDHGLLEVRGGRVKILREAEVRTDVAILAEIRLLTFALRHVQDHFSYDGFNLDINDLSKHPLSYARDQRPLPIEIQRLMSARAGGNAEQARVLASIGNPKRSFVAGGTV